MSCRDCDDVVTDQSWRGVAVETGFESLKKRVHEMPAGAGNRPRGSNAGMKARRHLRDLAPSNMKLGSDQRISSAPNENFQQCCV